MNELSIFITASIKNETQLNCLFECLKKIRDKYDDKIFIIDNNSLININYLENEKNNINANDLTELKKPEQKSINISYDEFIKLTTCHNCLKKFKSKQKLYLHYLDHSNSCDIPNDS